jgi:hypothetical protein
MIKAWRTGALALVVVAQMGAAMAQSTNPEATPNLDLSAGQKQTIYTSIRNLNIKNETPPHFQPLVGAVVPTEVKLEPMPKTIGELAPRLKDFQVGMISNQVVVVEPQSRKVVEVIAGEKQ